MQRWTDGPSLPLRRNKWAEHPHSALHKRQRFHSPVAEHWGVSQWKEARPFAAATSTHSIKIPAENKTTSTLQQEATVCDKVPVK